MRNYIRTILSFPFAVKWFLVTESLFGLGIGIWNISLNFHLKALGFSDVQIGIALALGSVLTAVLSLFAGEFGDRMGFHPAMVFGCILKGSGMFIIAIAPNIGFVFAGQIVISVGDSLVLSSEFPFLLGLVEEKHKHTVYNLLIFSFQFAMFFGNIAGGFMTTWFKAFRDPYLFSVALSGILFMTLGFGRSFLPRKKPEAVPRKVFIHLLKEKKILTYLFYGILSGAVFNLISSMINIIYRDEFKLSDVKIGFIFSINTIFSCLSAFLVPIILKRLKVINIAIAVQIIIVILLVVMSFSSYRIFAISWILWSFLRIMLPGTMDSAMLQSVNHEQQGAYSGLRIFSNNIGIGIGAYSAGSILMYLNYSVIMWIAAFIAAIQLLVTIFGCSRYLKSSNSLIPERGETFENS